MKKAALTSLMLLIFCGCVTQKPNRIRLVIEELADTPEIKLNDHQGLVWAKKGMNSKNPKNKIHYYNSALSEEKLWSSENLSILYNNRGVAFADLGQYHSARNDFNSSIEKNPKNIIAHFNRSKFFYIDRQYRNAIDGFTESLKLGFNPNYWVLFKYRGLSFFCLGDYPNALNDISNAIKLRAERELFYYRGWTYLALNDNAKARKDFRRIGMKYPTKKEVEIKYAWVYQCL